MEDDKCGWDFIVKYPDGCGGIFCGCYDSAVKFGSIIADATGRRVLCQFVGERDEYPTYDMLKVSFVCAPGGSIEHRKVSGEVDGKYEDCVAV